MAMLYPKNYCVFDFETSGLDPKKDRIIQVGALKVVDGKEEQCSWFIKYEDDFKVPEFITKITGITNEMLGFGMEPKKAWYEFLRFVDELPMIGHNIIKFDIPFLLQMNTHVGLDGGFSDLYEVERISKWCVDTAALYKARKMKADRFYNQPFYSFMEGVLETRVPGLKYNVGVVCDELGIDRSKVQQHRAEGDVYLTNEIYKKLCLNK